LNSAPTQSFIPKNPDRAKVNWQLVLAGNPSPKPALLPPPLTYSARVLQQKLMTTFCVTLVQNPTVQDMINLQKLQNLATLQQQQQQQHPHPHHGHHHQHQHQHHHPATAAALASLQGLAASVFNSPLNLSVGGEPAAAAGAAVAPSSPTHNGGGKSKTAKGGSSGNNSGGSATNSGSGSSSAQQQQQPDNPSSSSSPHHPLSASSLANVLAAATASPPPTLQAPPASAQMPQLILASGQLVQGVQGAQLLIPTAQGELPRVVVLCPSGSSWYQ